MMLTAASGPSAINFILKHNLAADAADSPLQNYFYIKAEAT